MTGKNKIEEKVYDSTNSDNEPWLINSNVEESYRDPLNNELMTAEYIWSQQGKDRESLVNRVFEMLRAKSFEDIIVKLSEEELKDKYQSLKNIGIDSVINENGEVVNSNSTGTDILKHFCGELFYSAAGESNKSLSCRDVFNDDEKLRRILTNRMGYRTSKEGGKERPYVFSMGDKMILQGMRSSGLAYSVSTFKPALAKFIVSNKEIVKPTQNNLVFDYSAGWGARALGVGSVGKQYYALDPLTHNKVNNLMSFYGIAGKVYNGGSERCNSYTEIVKLGLKNKFDTIFSSPPYFTLETYDNKQHEQSIVQYPDYQDWLDHYWDKTVENCLEYVLSPDSNNRTFVLIMLEKYKKYNLADDMVSICKSNGLVLERVYDFKTSKSHLSGKAKTQQISKNTEKIFVFR
jgi:hypothetical protein